MSKLALNKSSLSQLKKQLEAYQRFLPSLELKQKQLLAERKKAAALIERSAKAMLETNHRVANEFPMLASDTISLKGLMSVESVIVDEENLVGVKLPVLREVKIRKAQYGKLVRPHWVDGVSGLLEASLNLHVAYRVQTKRLEKLDEAVLSVTQRVNLFSKVLIPNARGDIKRISLFLADQERAAVVRSKIAKKKMATRILDDE